MGTTTITGTWQTTGEGTAEAIIGVGGAGVMAVFEVIRTVDIRTADIRTVDSTLEGGHRGHPKETEDADEIARGGLCHRVEAHPPSAGDQCPTGRIEPSVAGTQHGTPLHPHGVHPHTAPPDRQASHLPGQPATQLAGRSLRRARSHRAGTVGRRTVQQALSWDEVGVTGVGALEVWQAACRTPIVRKSSA